MPRLSKSKTTDSVDAASTVSTVSTVSAVSVSSADSSVKIKKVKAVKTEPLSTSAAAPLAAATAPVSVATTVTAAATTAAAALATASAAPLVDEAAPVEDVEASIAAQSVEFMSKLNQFSSMIASLKTEYRLLEKKWARELKAAQKCNSKKKKRAGNRAPSGFVKPTNISDELAKFLEKPTGTEMARTDVTREINKYIRSHNLQDAGNGRKINPDQKLQTLLKLKTSDELTYFNLQRYMSPHFHKAEKVVAAPV
jgi:upstream activation factor subunit UAF30